LNQPAFSAWANRAADTRSAIVERTSGSESRGRTWMFGPLRWSKRNLCGR